MFLSLIHSARICRAGRRTTYKIATYDMCALHIKQFFYSIDCKRYDTKQKMEALRESNSRPHKYSQGVQATF